VWIPEYSAGKLARFDPATERFTEWDLPVPEALPYIVRVDPSNGTVWIGTGHGDFIASFDTAEERFTIYPLPTRGALIRHIDIDEIRGEVWMAYGASPGVPSKVARLRP
jgi:virginiamycin B lyase